MHKMLKVTTKSLLVVNSNAKVFLFIAVIEGEFIKDKIFVFRYLTKVKAHKVTFLSI